MRFALLGPLTVTGPDGTQLSGPGPRQRVLLAALLLHANRPVPADALAELVWDGSPPGTRSRYAATSGGYGARWGRGRPRC